jgi:hypothetical protein
MKPRSAKTANSVLKNLKCRIGYSPNLKIALYIINSIGLGRHFSTQKVSKFPLKNKDLGDMAASVRGKNKIS